MRRDDELFIAFYFLFCLTGMYVDDIFPYYAKKTIWVRKILIPVIKVIPQLSIHKD